MPIERVSQQVPAQPTQSARSDDSQRPQTGRLGERQVTAGAGHQGELAADTERAQSPSPRHGTALLIS